MMTGERDSSSGHVHGVIGKWAGAWERIVSSTRPRAILHIRSPISWLFLHDVVGNIQLSESSETAAGRNNGWGRGNRSGATRVPQFSKVKVLRIVTDLGRTKVFVLHHRNARHKRGFTKAVVDRSGVAKTAARKSLPGSESQRFRLVSKLRTWHWRTCSNTTEKTYSSSSPREGLVGARHTAGVHGRADERGHDREKMVGGSALERTCGKPTSRMCSRSARRRDAMDRLARLGRFDGPPPACEGRR